MKYYKLVRDLPTFKKGELFYADDQGSLIRIEGDLMAYYYKTIEKFPNILGDWFVEVPDPVRDQKTKEAFIEYLDKHKDERFFQAVRNFTYQYISPAYRIEACYYKKEGDERKDTFYWECDEMLEEEDGRTSKEG